ncbi:cytochrome P450 [Sphingomonas immobilis]|uniref:Cytochrome P450 n=1 Tax=Sphingomonas immobilis TaxID=3063997 RepID=A0ABT9A0N1_9SPHN|nr:cytochrome P450 [Sphingomonas sp. CA1-15]MDO7842257.1 cytochrome P450 [Sphingomonas sp. CA1-15]
MTDLMEIMMSPPPEEPVHLDVEAPAHVPRELIRDLRNFQGQLPNSCPDPYIHTERLREADIPPVMWSPFPSTWIVGGHWVLTGYKDCAKVYQDGETYGSHGQADFQKLIGEDFKCIPLSFDGGEHSSYRRFLNPWFTPKAVGEMDADIRALCDEMIDEFLAKGGGDFAYDFARVFPVKVFFNLMGFPHAVLDQFLAWEYEILHTRDFERMGAATASVLAWLRDFITEKEARPDDSLTSKIVNGTIDGRPLTADEKIGTMFFLWLGGLDTVASTLGQMFRRLALDHGLQQRLRENPALIPGAIEEFLRMQPLVFSMRQLKKDQVLHGVEMKSGDWVQALTSVSNFDPETFKCPRDFDPERKGNRHFTLASGAHLCMGAHLARQEMKIALEHWLRRVPMFSIADSDDQMVSPGLMSVTNLHIAW